MQRGIRAFLGQHDPAERASGATIPAAAQSGSQGTPSELQFSRKRKWVIEGQEPAAERAQQQQPPGSSTATPASGSVQPLGGKAQRHLTQVYLDVGQRDFHSKRCSTCGMVYTPGDQGDERLHVAFHSNATKGLHYTAAQSDKALAVDGTRGKLVLVDVAAKAKRVLELAAFLEEQMGLARGWLLAVPCSVYLYISSATRRVLGCMMVESITEASRVVPPRPEQLLSCSSAAPARSSASSKSDSAAAASLVPAAAATGTPSSAPDAAAAAHPAAEQPTRRRAPGGGETAAVERSRRVKAMCGVRVMWTSVEARRRGVATKMLDCARAYAVRGYVVPRGATAFTQPTADGAAFIQRYTGTAEFLVY